jgi:uncharacterized protein YtpQ (UPF0354 family)
MRLMIGIVCALLLCAVAMAKADIAKPKTLNETLTLMVNAFQAESRVRDARTNANLSAVALTLPDETEVIAYPENLHAKLLMGESDAERQTILDAHIASILEGFLQSEQEYSTADHAQIYPVLRHREYRQTFEAEISDQEPGLKLVTIGSVGDTEILFVLDRPSHAVFLTQQLLEELQLTLSELEATAQGNLARKSESLRIEGEWLYFLELDGFYEASMLLEDNLWNKVINQIGDVLLAMPNRDLVVFLPTSTADAEKTLRDIISDYGVTQPYPLSEHIFRREGSDWVVLH